ncbi:unnamed protein product, partial [Effrenium voratum]
KPGGLADLGTDASSGGGLRSGDAVQGEGRKRREASRGCCGYAISGPGVSIP